MADSNSKPLPPLSDTDISRFWSKVDKTPGQGPHGDCWGWTGGKTPKGYPRLSYGSHGMISGTHVGYLVQYGEDPAPLFVCHSCDNSPCVRGEHLFKGSQKQNREDASRKGRTASGDRHGTHTHPEALKRGDEHFSRKHPELLARGERNGAITHPEKLLRGELHGKTKFKTQDIIRIRELLSSGMSSRRVASMYGVCKSSIQKIGNRESWRHIT